jgi:hypothetical protein
LTCVNCIHFSSTKIFHALGRTDSKSSGEDLRASSIIDSIVLMSIASRFLRIINARNSAADSIES